MVHFKENIMPKLENWAVVSGKSKPYQAPEQARPALTGLVYGRKYIADGSGVTTSNLLSLDIDNNVGVTENTTYDLGAPSVEWLTWLTAQGHDIKEFSFKA